MADPLPWLSVGSDNVPGRYACPSCGIVQSLPPLYGHGNYVVYHCPHCSHEWRVWNPERQLPLWAWAVIGLGLVATLLVCLFASAP